MARCKAPCHFCLAEILHLAERKTKTLILPPQSGGRIRVLVFGARSQLRVSILNRNQTGLTQDEKQDRVDNCQGDRSQNGAANPPAQTEALD
jgi:hypothetical protein